MPLFRRRRPPEFAAPGGFGSAIGTLPCSSDGCSNQTAVICAYRDRRGRACSMAFCPDHWSRVDGVVYCRRHAGTVVALRPGTESGGLPGLENRGPSLVSWVADEIGPDVEQLLRIAAREGETVKSEAEVTVIFDHQRRRRWERSWN